MRIIGALLSTLLTTAVASCGSPPGPTPQSAAISVSANPSTISGALCTGCGAGSTDREALTTLVIQETGGVAASVTSIEMTLREAGTNAVITSGSFEGPGVAQLAGTNRIAARGSLNVRTGVHYPAEQAGRSAVLTYIVRVTDDRGNQLSQTIAVNTTM
jgi:hypothetical protein